MNYGKRGTSKKQKSVNSKAAKVSKKASVLFIKAFLVCMLAAGVVVLCAGLGVVKGVLDRFYGGHLSSMVCSYLEQDNLSREELDALKSLLLKQTEKGGG